MYVLLYSVRYGTFYVMLLSLCLSNTGAVLSVRLSLNPCARGAPCQDLRLPITLDLQICLTNMYVYMDNIHTHTHAQAAWSFGYTCVHK